MLRDRLLRLQFEHRGSSHTLSEDGGPGSRSSQEESIEGEGLDFIPNREDHEQISVTSRLGALKPHAQGGLGIVFRASDRTLARDVALKFLRPDLAGNTETRNRFRLEAEITSQLEHPGVVPVYGLGTNGTNEMFYSMRFIQGETLDEAILRFHEAEESGEMSSDERERAQRRLLGHFIAVCKTIAYAHNRGIIHRDIKPENVMLGRYGETLVIDWGLAMPIARQGIFRDDSEKTLMPSTSDTNSSRNGWGGTPAYMSPEQAAGSVELTPATDVYSLGATLYKLIVGKAAFSGGFARAAKHIIRSEFPKPTEENPSASRILEAICLKAMAGNEDDRYSTALDLANDVENYLGDAPVTAYDETLSRRVSRWARRHRTLSQTFLVGLLLLTMAGATAAFIFDGARDLERDHRAKSLSVSSRFAARTIANEVDMRIRVLERAAEDREIATLMSQFNAEPGNDAHREKIQDWLNRLGEKNRAISKRAIYLCASDGTQVARYPQFTPEGKPYASLGKQYKYRDYFHGQGTDLRKEGGPPLESSHVSIAMTSTNDSSLATGFSTPIKRIGTNESIGVLGMSIRLGEFADLNIQLPDGQKALLIDTREYMMKPLKSGVAATQSGVGLVLHHKDLKAERGSAEIRHVNLETIEHLAAHAGRDEGDFGNLLPRSYQDPMATDRSASWLAAYAPVELTRRPKDSSVRDFGWYVIIQQDEG